MDLLTLIAKLRDLAAAVRAGDWLTAAKLAFELGLIILPLLPSPRPIMATSLSSKTPDELAADLEDVCNQHIGLTATVAANNPPVGGPFINLLVPIFLELMLKIIQNLK